MKLDRNINKDGTGKYALIKLRVDRPHEMEMFRYDFAISKEAVDFGDTPDTEFFVIRLKYRYAAPALHAYANAAEHDDLQYANEIRHLANLAQHHPSKRKPD